MLQRKANYTHVYNSLWFNRSCLRQNTLFDLPTEVNEVEL